MLKNNVKRRRRHEGTSAAVTMQDRLLGQSQQHGLQFTAYRVAGGDSHADVLHEHHCRFHPATGD